MAKKKKMESIKTLKKLKSAINRLSQNNQC